MFTAGTTQKTFTKDAGMFSISVWPLGRAETSSMWRIWEHLLCCATGSTLGWAAVGKDSFLPQLHLFLCSAVSPPSVSNLIPRSKSEIVVITVKTGLFTTLTIMSHMLFSFYSTTSTIKRNSFLWPSYIIVR